MMTHLSLFPVVFGFACTVFIINNFYTCLYLGFSDGHINEHESTHPWSVPKKAFVYLVHSTIMCLFGFVAINVHVSKVPPY